MKNLIEDFILFCLLTLILFSPFVTLFTFILLSYLWSIRTTLLIGLIYGIWMYIDRYTDVRGGRSSNFLRRLPIWSIVSNYFPMKSIKLKILIQIEIISLVIIHMVW